MKAIRIILIIVIVLLLGAQLVPVDRSNPPVTGKIVESPEVMAVLERACYDCHSNETNWPWYSYVAPVSWLVARDVKKGREELNFSTWNSISPGRQAHKISEAWEEVEEGKMPLPKYLRTHRDARLSDADRTVIHEWADARGEPKKESESDSSSGH